MLLLQIVILFAFFLIFFQDMSGRSVYWLIFPCLGISFLGLRLLQHQVFIEIARPIVFNLLFIAVQLLIISIYFSIKNRTWVNVTDELLGWGDVLFLCCIAFYLSALSFIIFYVFSLIGVLLIWLAWRAATNKKNEKIPLAGLQALIFVVFLAITWWFIPANLTNDNWLLNLMSK